VVGSVVDAILAFEKQGHGFDQGGGVSHRILRRLAHVQGCQLPVSAIQRAVKSADCSGSNASVYCQARKMSRMPGLRSWKIPSEPPWSPTASARNPLSHWATRSMLPESTHHVSAAAVMISGTVGA